MIDLRTYLDSKIRDIISTWDEKSIYAISFFVYANECNEYNGYSNVAEFYISYNTEEDCLGADAISEERWNYAFWRQNETPILVADPHDKGMKLLFDWYQENKIENIGFEDFKTAFDDKMRYIGKGPGGYYELLGIVSAVAKSLQESGFIKNHFGMPIPIIIHDLEYPWYIIEATKKANPNGEANQFLDAMKCMGMIE